MNLKTYPCGCQAGPAESVPDYCPDHDYAGNPVEVTEQEKAFVKAFSDLMKSCPKTILFSLQEDGFETGGKAELRLMRRTGYGATGLVPAFKIRHA